MMFEQLKQYVPKDVQAKLSKNIVIFEVPEAQWIETVKDLKQKNLSYKFLTATHAAKDSHDFNLWLVFGAPKEGGFVVPFLRLNDKETFPSLSSVLHPAENDERKIRTFFGLNPIGHPDPRPLILHEHWPEHVYPLRKDVPWDTKPKKANGSYPFQKVEGEGIYEIPVGPIHAGIIEPGHFRFSVAGEEIILLEPRLGFTHKGTEKLFETLPLEKMLHLSEKISGDSSFSHSLAFCQAIEQLSGSNPPDRAAFLRVIYAELERLANHFGDLGAIMLDTGFNFGGAHGARLREMIMRINERLTGSRFLRGVNVCGGVSKDMGDEEKKRLSGELSLILEDFSEVLKGAENSASLLNRLKGTGVISREIALDHGAAGVAAKAVGIKTDARVNFPYAAYDRLRLEKIETEESGDVYARFRVRVKEVGASIRLIQKALHQLAEGPICVERVGFFEKNAMALSVVEGWRGEIFYLITTDELGNINRVAPRDPSFVNWLLLGEAGVNNVVPDFPLINKSFNLSYTGNDL